MKEIELWLTKFINFTSITDNGEVCFIKQQIEKIRNMKIEVFNNDHNPPHFHVKSDSGDIDAIFRIDNCVLIAGSIDSKDKKRIETFHSQKKQLMENYWDKNHSKEN